MSAIENATLSSLNHSKPSKEDVKTKTGKLNGRHVKKSNASITNQHLQNSNSHSNSANFVGLIMALTTVSFATVEDINKMDSDKQTSNHSKRKIRKTHTNQKNINFIPKNSFQTNKSSNKKNCR